MLKVIPLQKNDFRGTKEADVLEIWFDKIPAKQHQEILEQAREAKRSRAKRPAKGGEPTKKVPTIPIIYKSESSPKEDLIKKAHYIDIDIKTPKATIQKIKKTNPKIKVIISYHNFKETPYEKELKAIHKKMQSKNPDIVKFASHAKSITDSFRMLDFLAHLDKKKQKAICLCMGKHGLLTRISGHLFGNYMMYFAPSKTRKTAPGQITIKEFKTYIHES